jgi:hypothetical protein
VIFVVVVVVVVKKKRKDLKFRPPRRGDMRAS